MSAVQLLVTIHSFNTRLLPRSGSAQEPYSMAVDNMNTADTMSTLGARAAERSEHFHTYMVRREMQTTEERIMKKVIAEVDHEVTFYFLAIA